MADPVTTATAIGWGIKVAGWVISPVASKVLSKGFSYLGSSNKVRKLERKIEQLKLMLEAAEDSPRRGRLETWMKELKSAFYTAEDILDAIEYKHLENSILTQNDDKSVGGLGAKFRRRGKQVLGNISDKISITSRMKLKATLDTIEKLINEGYQILPLSILAASCGNMNNPPNNTVIPPIRTISAPSDEVFGRNEDLNMIRTMLRDTPADVEPSSSRTKCYSVIGIHGIQGSGKTTLAQYVYQNEKEDDYFNLFMWIHVSQNFSVDTIFTEMLEIASNSRTQYSNPDILQSKLQEELRGKRFLLVLDDYYDEGFQKRDKLLSPLMAGNKGSKILVTTRFEDAARDLGSHNPFAIPELGGDQYLSMFMHYALDGTTTDDPAFREHWLTGRQIAEKLGRSPLAARTVAAQLNRRRQDVGFWRSTLNDSDLLKDTMTALLWSYQQLDEHVRQCFTFCSIFPRRYRLGRDELVHLWMALGFVETPDGTKDMEDVGNDYLQVLMSSSFIQEKLDQYNLEYYVIHDLLHDLAKNVAGSDCLRIVKGMVKEKIPGDVRHLFVESDNASAFLEQISKLESLRTLIIPYGSDKLSATDFERMLKSTKKLRVLHVGVELLGGTIPACICRLKHLRYLLVQVPWCRKHQALPASFTKLYHLQWFSMGRSYFHFPSEMANLVNLQHIDCAFLRFPNVGRLKWLRSLPYFNVRRAKGYEIKQLEHLNNIRGSLNIEGLAKVKSKEEARRAKLANKTRLSGLTLDWSWYEFQGPSLLLKDQGGRWSSDILRTIFHGCGSSRQTEERNCDPPEEIFEALRPPPLITSLTVDGYRGLTYPSWLSGEQGTLLNLKSLRFQRNESDAPPKFSEFLGDLRHLSIIDCSWNSLPDMECLTSLEELDIWNCKNILSLPKLPQSLQKLQLIKLNGSDAFSWNISDQFLVNLRTIRIECCRWNSLPENMEHLTSLEMLIIMECENILTLPKLPASLMYISLRGCNQSLLASCQMEGHPNWQKIEHVARKYFD
ncbi:hypothetical protein ACP70R_025746 [Stipagrostis hirtigluma subsp. patula]